MFLYAVTMVTKVTTYEQNWGNAIFLSQFFPNSKEKDKVKMCLYPVTIAT